MTIALTGATGFVGRQILRALLLQGSDVRVLLRDPTKLIDEAKHHRVEVFQTGDLFVESAARLALLLAGTETLIHAAWYAAPGKYLTSARNLDCLKGTLELARAFADVGGKRFVGIGSCAEYDLSAGVVSPDTALSPNTLYAACKASTFQVLRQLTSDLGISFAWCRLFYLYGEGEDDRRLVPYLRKQLAAGEEVLLTRGDQIRDFLDVREAGRVIADLALSEQQGAVNVCSGTGVTVRQLAESIADEFGRRDLLRFGVRPENLFDPQCVIGVPGGAA
jgi:nucleoside-diphosphate-sugar epimerase